MALARKANRTPEFFGLKTRKKENERRHFLFVIWAASGCFCDFVLSNKSSIIFLILPEKKFRVQDSRPSKRLYHEKDFDAEPPRVENELTDKWRFATNGNRAGKRVAFCHEPKLNRRTNGILPQDEIELADVWRFATR